MLVFESGADHHVMCGHMVLNGNCKFLEDLYLRFTYDAQEILRIMPHAVGDAWVHGPS